MIPLSGDVQRARVPSNLEPMSVDKGDGKRPVVIIVFPPSNWISSCWSDVCTDTYDEIKIYSSVVLEGQAARKAERRKLRQYGVLGLTDLSLK